MSYTRVVWCANVCYACCVLHLVGVALCCVARMCCMACVVRGVCTPGAC